MPAMLEVDAIPGLAPRRACANAEWRARLQRLVDIDAPGQDLVIDLDQLEGVGRDLQRNGGRCVTRAFSRAITLRLL
jgi:hypothetical protein